jgi:hypothetical protein
MLLVFIYQWLKEKRQNTTHKTKDQATRIPPKPGGELRCSGRVPHIKPKIKQHEFHQNPAVNYNNNN